MEEFSDFTEETAEVVVWTDFKRINQTHFWSPNRKIYIEPAITHVDQIMGDRKSFAHRIFKGRCLI